MSDAQSGALGRTDGSVLVVFAIGLVGRGALLLTERSIRHRVVRIAELVNGVDGRGGHIAAAGPLAEIDQAAALGAEGKLGLVAQNDLAAGGTKQAATFFAGHANIVAIY